MQFKTHNDKAISTVGSSLQGEVNATYEEIGNLFGGSAGNDGYKTDAEWRVEFDDGTVASIYNYKDGVNYNGESGTPVEQITNWHVGGFGISALHKVQIAIDLAREQKESEKEQDPVEKAFESALSIMDTLKSAKGDKYARVVELALLIRKQHELTGVVAESSRIPQEALELIHETSSMMCAKIISIAVDIAGIECTKKDSEEIMEWTDRMVKAEAQGVKSLLKKGA